MRLVSQKARSAQVKVPRANGRGVPLKAKPMGMAMITAPTVEVAVMIEAADPAMWPMGSIASALRLPIVRPA